LKLFHSGLRRHQNSHLEDPKGGNTKQRSLFLEKGLFWFISEDFAIFGCHITLYIKANMVVSVCVDKNWAVIGRIFQSLPVPCAAGLSVVTNRAGAGQGAISIKEILEENQGTCI
jgi:heme/copper-type cytochrome/quinol oxidase subunit 3